MDSNTLKPKEGKTCSFKNWNNIQWFYELSAECRKLAVNFILKLPPLVSVSNLSLKLIGRTLHKRNI